jgi:transposase-like protein
LVSAQNDGDQAVLAAPTVCPFCQSSKVSVPTEKVDANTYWRCDACGQMWNVGRLRPARHQFGGRWNNGF